jgi:succinate dehydrogenase / fumarate reductase cytochrome b subunit
MAYIPERKPLGSWSKILFAYKRHSGSWAYILHRISGIGLTFYLFLHILALSGLTKGRAAFQEEMALFTTPPFKFLEWFLGALVMFHAFNGIRIAVVDLGSGAKNNKLLLRLVWGTGITVVLFMFVLIFQEEIFGHPLF